MDIYTDILSKTVKNNLKKVPFYIAIKLYGWIEAVSHEGLLKVIEVNKHDYS